MISAAMFRGRGSAYRRSCILVLNFISLFLSPVLPRGSSRLTDLYYNKHTRIRSKSHVSKWKCSDLEMFACSNRIVWKFEYFPSCRMNSLCELWGSVLPLESLCACVYTPPYHFHLSLHSSPIRALLFSRTVFIVVPFCHIQLICTLRACALANFRSRAFHSEDDFHFLSGRSGRLFHIVRHFSSSGERRIEGLAKMAVETV